MDNGYFLACEIERENKTSRMKRARPVGPLVPSISTVIVIYSDDRATALSPRWYELAIMLVGRSKLRHYLGWCNCLQVSIMHCGTRRQALARMLRAVRNQVPF